MKLKIENLGAIDYAEIDIGDISILCGKNNTGKTYLTYSLYCFLYFWHKMFHISIPKKIIETLINDGTVRINISDFINNSDKILEDASLKYTQVLPSLLAAEQQRFKKTRFSVSLEKSSIIPMEEGKLEFGSPKRTLFFAQKKKEDSYIEVTLLIEKSELKIRPYSVESALNIIIKNIVFGNSVPSMFIASTERTGAITFTNDLDIKKNIYIREITKREADIDPFEIEEAVESAYSLPIRDDVKFNRNISSLIKQEGFVKKHYPEIIKFFDSIVQGTLTYEKNRKLYYKIKGKKLTIDETSSSIRSLIDIGLYIKHVSRPNDILIIDEPELNLHPENQRKLARLLVKLANIGIKIFITTHSDYIIKELNNLILMTYRFKETSLPRTLTTYGYDKTDTFDISMLKVFKTDRTKILIPGNTRRTIKNTILPMNVSEKNGISADCFDETINQMNTIEDFILYGDE